MKVSKILLSFVLILAFALIGFSIGLVITNHSYSNALENPNGPVTPVDPVTPEDPVTPDDPDVPDEPDTPIDDSVITDFSFSGNTVTQYLGEGTNFEIPSSYSLGEGTTYTYEIEDGYINGLVMADQFIQTLLQKGLTIKFTFEDGTSAEVNQEEYQMDPGMSSRAVAIEYTEYQFLVGDDIQVTTLGQLLFAGVGEGTFVCPSFITEIEIGAFRMTTFDTVDLSQTNITELSSGCFAHATTLESVILGGDTVIEFDTSTYNGTFSYCSATIYVPANLLESYKTTYSTLADRFVAVD